jgi:hypothetical protein
VQIHIQTPFSPTRLGAIASLAKDFGARGVKIIAVSSNSIETHPQDGPDAIAKEAKDLGEQPEKRTGGRRQPIPRLGLQEAHAALWHPLHCPQTPQNRRRPPPLPPGYSFPYLYDATQEVARDYKVACTPEFYVLDGSLNLVYHGQFDDSRPNNNSLVTGEISRSLWPLHLIDLGMGL